MYSLANGGIKSKLYDQIRRDICQVYGFKHIVTFQNLSKVGLLTVSSGVKGAYSVMSKNFKLINDYESNIDNKDPSYVYAGYVPLCVRICQAAKGTFDSSKNITNDGFSWKKYSDIMALLPGEIFDEAQPLKLDEIVVDPKSSKSNASTLLVLLGGCTLAQISAIRALSKTSGRKWTTLTTGIISASKVFESIVEN